MILLKRSKPLILLVLLVLTYSVQAQEDNGLKWGEVTGEWRNYYMRTWNNDSLKDFQALATGGYIKYSQPLGSYFTIAGAYYNTFNFNIQDLTKADASTGRLSRYELGLFDVNDPEDRYVGYFGELYGKLNFNEHYLTIGRMKLKSPFINPQDGRMIPTLIQGFWYEYQFEQSIGIKGGFFNRIAPRSTNGFMKIGESIGKYPVGRGQDGSPSLYQGVTNSDYIVISNLTTKIGQIIKVQFWNYYVDNLFNATYIKPEWHMNNQITLAGEWLHQEQVGNGGNVAEPSRYFSDERADVFGFELSYKIKKGKITLGYNRITSSGRYLFPREWGREFLFSFQKRERSEGSADNHALVMNYIQNTDLGKNVKLKSILSIGHHWKPDVTNAEANKYAHPDYTHINLDMFWEIEKIKGFKPELLLTYKRGSDNIPNNSNFYFNKVDMMMVNVILNYGF